MSPFAFETACLVRSRGAWAALLLALAPAALTLAATAAVRQVTNQPEALARLWLPTVFVVASMAQAGLLPFVLTYLLGDSLAGQAEDGRLKSQLLSPAGMPALYLGKLGASAAVALAVLAGSAALHGASAALALSASGPMPSLGGRDYGRSFLLFEGLQIASALALLAFLGMVFSFVRSFKAGLLGAAALGAGMLFVQFAAPRIDDSLAWLPQLMFTQHYWRAGSPALLIAVSTGALEASRAVGVTLASLAGDVLAFGALGYLAFRRRPI